MRNSGYGLEQVREIVWSGIKGFEGKSVELGVRFRKTAKESKGARYMKD